MKIRVFACVASVVLICAAIFAWRANRWSIVAVRDVSDATHRRLCVEIATRGEVPWPLRLAVAAVDPAGKRIESTLPRWEARQIGPQRVELTFAERVTDRTAPVAFDLKLAASGHAALHVQQVLESTQANEPRVPTL